MDSIGGSGIGSASSGGGGAGPTSQLPLAHLKEHRAGAGDPGCIWSGWLPVTDGGELAIRSGWHVDGISLADKDVGGSGGGEVRWQLERNEHITSVSGHIGNVVDSICFHTSGSRALRSEGREGSSSPFCFLGESVGRIYYIGFMTGPYHNIDNLVHQVAILSER